jgi:signal transduction histidine kinase
VTIRVEDTGPGIDPEMLSTLFEPFVSSRLDSKGTGLGLAVAEGIVREHAGTVIARNRRGTLGGGVRDRDAPTGAAERGARRRRRGRAGRDG